MRCNSNNPYGNNYRVLRKSTNLNERRLFQSYWQELVNIYGTYIDYYTDMYSLTSHDSFYGEDTTAPYSKPTGLVLLAEFNNDSLLLSKFGIQTDADATFIIPILTYRETFGPNAEPKSGDLIRMTELGLDRPGGLNDMNTITAMPTACDERFDPLKAVCRENSEDGAVVDCHTDEQLTSEYDDLNNFNNLLRGAPVFEITERRDEILNMQYNSLLGHYVWIIHAKQYDYSYRPEAPRTPGSDQVSDDTLYGKLSGDNNSNWAENPKLYEQNTEKQSNEIWDYDMHSNSNDSVYGEY